MTLTLSNSFTQDEVLDLILLGLKMKASSLEVKMHGLRSALAPDTVKVEAPAVKLKHNKRRKLSPEAIERIRAAQKKRWAKVKRAKK